MVKDMNFDFFEFVTELKEEIENRAAAEMADIENMGSEAGEMAFDAIYDEKEGELNALYNWLAYRGASEEQLNTADELLFGEGARA